MSDATHLDMLMPPVSRYMTLTPHVVAPRDRLSTASELMHRYQVHHLPVIDHDKLVGIVSDRDLKASSMFDDRVADAMTRDVVAVDACTGLDEVLALMQERCVNSVVVAGTGGIEGIFTSTDAMRAMSDLLERADASQR